MAVKGPVYKVENGTAVNEDLVKQLYAAVFELSEKMKVSIPITRANTRIGWGVNKAQRNIAADSVISIAKTIKAIKGW